MELTLPVSLERDPPDLSKMLSCADAGPLMLKQAIIAQPNEMAFTNLDN
jgi:hypothetical protein